LAEDSVNKKIVLISPGQPSLNPRLVKEADALTGAGYDVTVLYAYWNQWGTEHDEQLLPQKKWKAIRIGGDPVKKSLTYFITRIRLKVANLLYKWFPTALLSEFTIARAARSLRAEAARHDADIYIAHNLGALPAAVKAAKRHGAKCGFDAEDFHRQEINDDVNDIHYRRCKTIEDKYLPGVDYLTASSKPIAAAYRQLYPQLDPVVIRNVFAVDADVPFKAHSGKLKLLWFSQTIGPNRGLDDVIAALQLLNNRSIELHLLGHLPDATRTGYLDKLQQNKPVCIHFHKPIPAAELVTFAVGFDIGLALEPGFCLNNSLALSNKVFTYLQAGLAVLATDTTAQKDFLDAYPGAGRCYKAGDAGALSELIDFYFNYRRELLNTREAAFRLSHGELNWENESKKLLALVANTLNSN
jgi:glycosyltransferase involved in cell wall biosynthesis